MREMEGGEGGEVMCCHWGSPERLGGVSGVWVRRGGEREVNLMEVTSQPLLTAALHIREPRKPLPPQTTSRLAAVIVLGSELGLCGEWLIHVMRLME